MPKLTMKISKVEKAAARNPEETAPTALPALMAISSQAAASFLRFSSMESASIVDRSTAVEKTNLPHGQSAGY